MDLSIVTVNIQRDLSDAKKILFLIDNLEYIVKHVRGGDEEVLLVIILPEYHLTRSLRTNHDELKLVIKELQKKVATFKNIMLIPGTFLSNQQFDNIDSFEHKVEKIENNYIALAQLNLFKNNIQTEHQLFKQQRIINTHNIPKVVRNTAHILTSDDIVTEKKLKHHKVVPFYECRGIPEPNLFYIGKTNITHSLQLADKTNFKLMLMICAEYGDSDLFQKIKDDQPELQVVVSATIPPFPGHHVGPITVQVDQRGGTQIVRCYVDPQHPKFVSYKRVSIGTYSIMEQGIDFAQEELLLTSHDHVKAEPIVTLVSNKGHITVYKSGDIKALADKIRDDKSFLQSEESNWFYDDPIIFPLMAGYDIFPILRKYLVLHPEITNITLSRFLALRDANGISILSYALNSEINGKLMASLYKSDELHKILKCPNQNILNDEKKLIILVSGLKIKYLFDILNLPNNDGHVFLTLARAPGVLKEALERRFPIIEKVKRDYHWSMMLRCKNRDQNIFHIAAKDSDLIHAILARFILNDLISEQDNNGNTPLHYVTNLKTAALFLNELSDPKRLLSIKNSQQLEPLAQFKAFWKSLLLEKIVLISLIELDEASCKELSSKSTIEEAQDYIIAYLEADSPCPNVTRIQQTILDAYDPRLETKDAKLDTLKRMWDNDTDQGCIHRL